MGFASRQKDDFELALLALNERRAGDLDLLFIAGGVFDLERTTAVDLKTIVVNRPRGDAVNAKAGAGVVDFEELNVGAGAVLDGCVDVVGVASGDGEKSAGKKNCEDCAAWCGDAGHLFSSSLGGAEPTAEEFGAACLAASFSRRSSRLSSSGRRWKMATARSQMRLSKPGEPEIILPGGTSWETAD